jgi:acetyltransferase-like isoleucine patch superfamily enzyme
MIVIVMRQKAASGLPQADLAGRPFASHLPAHFLSMAMDGGLVVDSENPFPGQPELLDTELLAGHDLLLVSADAWFSVVALEKLKSVIAANPGKIRLVRVGEVEAGVQAPLAIYLPASEAGTLLSRHGLSLFNGSIGDLGHRIEGSEVVTAESLDPVLAPVRIDNLLDLAILERALLYERACVALLSGIRIRDPNRVAIRGDLRCGVGVEIDVDVIIEGKVTLGDGARIGANSILINSTIGPNTRVNPFSIVEDAVIGSNSFVGPYGRVRPGSKIGDSAQIGNFVEIKNSQIGSGSRVNHLAFIGDATLEKDVTIGAGSITCNHDGIGVRHTEIKAGAYVGSGSKLVAPLSIGENATIGAGSTITRDVPAGKLTVARSRQVTVEHWTRPDKKLADK